MTTCTQITYRQIHRCCYATGGRNRDGHRGDGAVHAPAVALADSAATTLPIAPGAVALGLPFTAASSKHRRLDGG